MAGEDPLAMLAEYFDLIEHVQLADVPGRHEPGTGTVDYATVFGLLEQRGYVGWIGLEYVPRDPEMHDPRGWIGRYG
jgi:hydroxypyruvate isomerase